MGNVIIQQPVSNYQSSKRMGPISTGHRQWRDNGHCAFVHGYGRYVELNFGCSELDHRSWVVDFGSLKDVKRWIESQWDHRTLIASDDPYLDELQKLADMGVININILDVEKGYGPGIEASCKFIFDHVNSHILDTSNGRCWVESVKIWEHENNTATYSRPPAS